MIVIVILLALAGLVLVSATFAAVSGAPWVPAFKKDVSAVLDDAGVEVGNKVIELGCGDGRLLAAAARRGAMVTGYEINPALWLFAWLRLRRYKGSRIVLGDFWRHNLGAYDVVITFLVPRTTPKLEQKAAREMQPGSRLLSYIFKLPHKKAKISRHHWYVYDY